jgi:hypothetical protein
MAALLVVEVLAAQVGCRAEVVPVNDSPLRAAPPESTSASGALQPRAPSQSTAQLPATTNTAVENRLPIYGLPPRPDSRSRLNRK